MLEELKQELYEANLLLPKNNLVTLTWGNVSGIDQKSRLFVIKPSGVTYEALTPEDMVVVNLKGEVIEGNLNPSSDTMTHAILYQNWPDIGGIVHTHSQWAVAFSQAGMDIPAAGTTHADTFYGPVPVSKQLTEAEIACEYEKNTGKVIVRTFKERSIKPMDVPAILVNDHGPFSWGNSAYDAVQHAIVLENVAEMTYHTLQLNSKDIPVPEFLLKRHYERKHGPDAYYGQKK